MAKDLKQTKRKEITWEDMKEYIEKHAPDDKDEFKAHAYIDKTIKGKTNKLWDIVEARKWFVEKYDLGKKKPSEIFKDW